MSTTLRRKAVFFRGLPLHLLNWSIHCLNSLQKREVGFSSQKKKKKKRFLVLAEKPKSKMFACINSGHLRGLLAIWIVMYYVLNICSDCLGGHANSKET